MIPQISGAIGAEPIEVVPFPSKSYRLSDMQIVGSVDGLDAVRQAVYHILSAERYAYAIYGDSYGVELEQYIGRSFGYLETTIERTLRDALMQDDRILSVDVIGVTKQSVDSALVQFNVTSSLGTFGGEVNINV